MYRVWKHFFEFIKCNFLIPCHYCIARRMKNLTNNFRIRMQSRRNRGQCNFISFNLMCNLIIRNTLADTGSFIVDFLYTYHLLVQRIGCLLHCFYNLSVNYFNQEADIIVENALLLSPIYACIYRFQIHSFITLNMYFLLGNIEARRINEEHKIFFFFLIY